jgi:hypothetical protein
MLEVAEGDKESACNLEQTARWLQASRREGCIQQASGVATGRYRDFQSYCFSNQRWHHEALTMLFVHTVDAGLCTTPYSAVSQTHKQTCAIFTLYHWFVITLSDTRSAVSMLFGTLSRSSSRRTAARHIVLEGACGGHTHCGCALKGT